MTTFPDENLFRHTMSLEDFVLRAKELSMDPDQYDDFINFTLAGRNQARQLDGTTREERIFVNPSMGITGPRMYRVVGDFDSVIGITQHLPFTQPIEWHCFPLFKHTLKADVHIEHSYVKNVRKLLPIIFISLTGNTGPDDQGTPSFDSELHVPQVWRASSGTPLLPRAP